MDMEAKATTLRRRLHLPVALSTRIQRTGKLHCSSDSRRFIIMLFLTGSYFVVELVVGLWIGSLALVADAFHMLSDIIALIVGLFSVTATKREATDDATYGWVRMEVVGGLINGTFLAALCFSIILDAIERLSTPGNDNLEANGVTLLIVACVGLGVNILGLGIFGSHGHGDGDSHGHSHGGRSNVGDNLENSSTQVRAPTNMNIKGVWLHVLGDALGSIAVIISAIVIIFSTSPYRTLADPICSLVITAFILSSSIPLILQATEVLLQHTPKGFNLDRLRRNLCAVNGVLQIHELHVWQLTPDKVVGSCHALLDPETQFMSISDTMKNVFHTNGVHSSAIQPEYPVTDTMNVPAGVSLCHDPVCEPVDCQSKFCCPSASSASSSEPLL